MPWKATQPTISNDVAPVKRLADSFFILWITGVVAIFQHFEHTSGSALCAPFYLRSMIFTRVQPDGSGPCLTSSFWWCCPPDISSVMVDHDGGEQAPIVDEIALIKGRPFRTALFGIRKFNTVLASSPSLRK